MASGSVGDGGTLGGGVSPSSSARSWASRRATGPNAPRNSTPDSVDTIVGSISIART
jgi:hypothetical protein